MNNDKNENTFLLTPPFPRKMMLEVSNLCNHKCIFCSNSKANRKNQIIDNDLAERVIKEGYECGIREISFHGMGEPLICKDLQDYIKLAKDIGYTYVYIDTNGALAIPSIINPVVDAGLDSIKISVSAANSQDFTVVQGKEDFDLVINNIKQLSNYRKNKNMGFKIYVDFVETKYTIGQFDQLKELLVDFVDEVWFSPCGTQGGNMEEECEKIGVTKISPALCREPFERITVTCEGLVSACCMDNDNNLIYADIKETNLREAWNNINVKEIRNQHLTGENINNFCKKCDLNVYAEYNKIH